jgi:hypothetical protein
MEMYFMIALFAARAIDGLGKYYGDGVLLDLGSRARAVGSVGDAPARTFSQQSLAVTHHSEHSGHEQEYYHTLYIHTYKLTIPTIGA